MARSRFWRVLRGFRIALASVCLAAFTLAFGYLADVLALLSRWGLEKVLPEPETFEPLTEIAKVQFAPSLLAALQTRSLHLLLIVAALLLLTALCGRAYCSVLCPLGILQDLLGALFFWRKKGPQPRLFALRKGLGALVWVMAILGGWTLGLRFLDPFSLFGRIVACAWLPLVVLAAMTFWRRRLFCNSLCPVGAMLACLSAKTPLGLRIKPEACIHCGKCVKACPAGCVDPMTGTLDNGRCIRCLECAAACPVGAITYGKNPGAKLPTRREVITVGSLLAGATAIGLAARPAKALYSAYGPRFGVAHEGIYPPGAGSRQRFITKCTNCGLCVQNCVGQVLQIAGTHGAVHLTFDKGMCEFYCKRCIEVCPTGALQEMSLETKQRTRLGRAELELSLCVAATEGFDCGACAEHCPTGALRMKEGDEGFRIPVLDSRLCIGCGSCEHPCPVKPIKAVRVWPIDVQVQAADPAELLQQETPAEEPASDDWLI